MRKRRDGSARRESKVVGGIIERLETLEKQNRRLKRSGLAAIVTVGSLLFMGQVAAIWRRLSEKQPLGRQ